MVSKDWMLGMGMLWFLHLAEGHLPETGDGMLFPQDSETRQTKTLDGIWNFRIAPRNDPDRGFRDQWYSCPLAQKGDVIPMPVPSSYNDITQNSSIRDHVGWAWYDRTFYAPSWNAGKQRYVLRVGSAHYNTMVWLNGMNVLNHSGGHLPFQVDVTRYLQYTDSNLLTIAINNTLTPETIPQGYVAYRTDVNRYPPGYFTQEYTFDFFNYAGIHRSVILYSTPKLYIDDVSVVTNLEENNTASIYFKVLTKPQQAAVSLPNASCLVELIDKEGTTVGSNKNCAGKLAISNVNLWWPHTMSENPGYLYTMKVQLLQDDSPADVYRLRTGVRTVTWDENTLLINNKPFYFRGFGKHEDSNIRGKGLDLPLIVKDFNLIKWLGANSFRTSHYPYADEILDRADEEGIVVIDECPGVNLDNFDDVLLENHKLVMKELIRRDKNHPSVIMWSIGNEPRSQKPAAGPYFKQVVAFVKGLDPVRPVTLVLNADLSSDKAAPYLDILCINRYFGWYSDVGHLELIQRQVVNEFTSWHKKHNKPVLISEYGADTIAGLHMDPPFVFTEDFQMAYLQQHFKAFDQLRSQKFFIGEMIWNFADFMTKQEIQRVVGNKKGILTRERQPKVSARILRSRYWSLAQQIDHWSDFPEDIQQTCYFAN